MHLYTQKYTDMCMYLCILANIHIWIYINTNICIYANTRHIADT